MDSEKMKAIAKYLCAAILLGLVVVASISEKNRIRPQGIVVHHSALPEEVFGPIDASIIDAVHEERGFHAFYWGRIYHIGYHYIILPDGTVQKGRPEHLRGAHAVNFNDYIGICLVGNFGSDGRDTVTAAQFEALASLVRQIQKRYNLPAEQIRLHRQVSPKTECPGERFPEADFYAAISPLAGSKH